MTQTKYKQTHKMWRQKEEIKLKELYEQGLKLREIGLQLGRDKISIAHKISQLKKCKELQRRKYKISLNEVYYNSSNNEISKFKQGKGRYAELNKANYELISWYDQENETAGLTPTTRWGLIRDISTFGIWIKEKKLKELSVDEIKEYERFLGLRLGKTSIKVHKSRIKGLYVEMLKDKSCKENIQLVFNYLDTKSRGRKKENDVTEAKARLTKTQIVKLVGAIKGADKGSIRDRAIIASLYDSGCRCSEFLSIRVKDAQVDGKFPHYYVPMSKTKPRDCHILSFSLPYVMEWKKQHEFLDNPDAPFFYSFSTKNYGESLTVRIPQLILKKAANIAGIKEVVSPHILRDSKAVHCAEAGMTAAEANLLFGWDRGSSMFNYYSTISTNALRLREKERGGQLTIEQIEELKEERNAFVSTNCNRCHTTILPDQFVCSKCGLAKNKKVAEIELQKEKKAEATISDLKKSMEEMPSKFLAELVKNPEVLRQALEIKRGK